MDQKQKLKTLFIIFLNFLISYAVLRLIILWSERTGIMPIYYIGSSLYAAGASGLFIAYFCLNGYTLNREPRTADELPEKWTDEQKAEFMEKQPARREKAKRLMYILLPVVMTLFISCIELMLIK